MKNLVILTLGAVVLFGGMAQAQLVSFSTDELFSWSYSGAIVTQSISTPTNEVTMTVDAESAFTIVSTTVNETGFTWTGYILTLASEGLATFVEEKAGSIQFPALDFSNRELVFGGGQVMPGNLAVFQFDINIPDGPPYTFSLTHTPIPEPATFALLGLGAIVLVAGKRRKK